MKFPFIQQLDYMDCGPTCLQMISKFYGKTYNLESLRQLTQINREGASFLGISHAAEKIGFRTMAVKVPFSVLKEEVPLPTIAHWNQEHFVVVYKIEKQKVWVSDPAFGRLKYSEKEFLEKWSPDTSQEDPEGLCLILEPTEEFYRNEDESNDKRGFINILRYYKPYKKLIYQIIIGLLVSIVLQIIMPFLTQALVDIGITNLDTNFVTLVLLAQLFIFIGQTSINILRSWVLLHVNSRVNVAIIAEFLMKLMKLPISFFEAKRAGDVMQRIKDHDRIESFLSNYGINIIFSAVSLFVFSGIMLYYDWRIFLIFLIGSTLYIAWIFIFLKRRRELDYKQFDMLSDHQNTLIELINGMQEIKLQNYERAKRWEWERLKARIYKIDIKSLTLNQFQRSGAKFIDQLKNILVIGTSAFFVVEGKLSLGMMLSLQYILGQLNAPLLTVVDFIITLQDARISLDRLNEIHAQKNEEEQNGTKQLSIPESGDIVVEDLKFRYGGIDSEWILKDISLTLPRGKVTAIVGASGSGKTTLVKLLLGFYPPTEGKISVGQTGLEQIENEIWRSNCGAVMQDGFIFSDTISKNISVTEINENPQLVMEAANTAAIHDSIMHMPLKYNTRIGNTGLALSMGQKQRLLIARVVYKNPHFVFFDEATNSLDANNERKIVENLDRFYDGKTVVIVAHRLSTVKNADQILVLDQGKIAEIGSHQELITKKGAYYELIKNQLELGN